MVLASCFPISVGCGEETPSAEIVPADHIVCVDGETDGAIDQGILTPFGDTGVLDADGGVVDGTESEGLGDRAPGTRSRGRSQEDFRSTVGCRSPEGRDDIWDRARIGSLTYCFGSFEDAQLELEVRDAFEIATWEYELATDVNFVHRLELDGRSCTKDSDVVFVVREGGDADCSIFGCPLADAFFPSMAEGSAPQDVVFFPEAVDHPEFGVKGIVQHELGHVLGLWHEHARFVQDDGVLSQDRELKCMLSAGWSSSWRGVTPPDPDSVMGYPYCRGTPGGAVGLSPMDRLALRYHYALPALRHQSFDEGTTSDILWFLPREGVLTLWYGNEGVPISFAEVALCSDEASGDCPGGVQSAWKPIPLAEAGQAHVLMYGPGDTPDLKIEGTLVPGTFDYRAVPVGHETAVPRVGDLAGSPSVEDVLFVLPGEGEGDWGLEAGNSSFVTHESIQGVDGFFDAAVGDFDPSGAVLGDQILWYSESTTGWWMTSRNGEGLQDVAFNPCALPIGGPIDPLVGNFDADDTDEILWYLPDEDLLLLWLAVEDCAADQIAFALEGRPLPHAGDFDGDGRLDVLWDRPGANDELWRFVDPASPVVEPMTLPGDTVPVVGDFDGDGCSDVLWYRGYAPTSDLWHSSCDGTFMGTTLETPMNADPIGYHYGHGRAHRG